MYGIVYKITNLQDGKVYIGQTIQPLWKRWRSHCYHADRTDGCPKLARAIKKYGIEGFSVEEIAQAASKEELDSLECHYIEFYEGIARGYNLSTGGANKVPSDEARRKMSEAQKRRGPRPSPKPESIERMRQTKLAQHNHHSDEARLHLSEVSKKQDKSHLRTDEIRDKISETLLARGPAPLSTSKPCIVNGVTYQYPTEAAKALDIRITTLMRVLKGERKSTKFSACFVNPEDASAKHNKPIEYDGVFYTSIAEAHRATGKTKPHLRKFGKLSKE